VVTTDDIRRLATALPEVEETGHFRFRVPLFKVRGKTFAGMGKDETTVVFCVTEQEAASVTAAAPAGCASIRRMDAKRSFLDLQVELSRFSEARIRGLVEGAWSPSKTRARRLRDGRYMGRKHLPEPALRRIGCRHPTRHRRTQRSARCVGSVRVGRNSTSPAGQPAGPRGDLLRLSRTHHPTPTRIVAVAFMIVTFGTRPIRVTWEGLKNDAPAT
jgi:hypothetical protein